MWFCARVAARDILVASVMATRIFNFHGSQPLSLASSNFARRHLCPFTPPSASSRAKGNTAAFARCHKKNGVCALLAAKSEAPVIICPERMYGRNFSVLRRVVSETFGVDHEIIEASEAQLRQKRRTLTGCEIVAFGKYHSGELGIPAPGDGDSSGTFKVDYVLAKIDSNLNVLSFVAVEVQSIDTTESYAAKARELYGGTLPGVSKAGFNWENVSKRILPQLIYKGHALRRESLAEFGMYFITPLPVLRKIVARVGGAMINYPRGPGTITFHPYKLGDGDGSNNPDSLIYCDTEVFTTTVEQLAFAFVSPQNLPELGIYRKKIELRLG